MNLGSFIIQFQDPGHLSDFCHYELEQLKRESYICTSDLPVVLNIYNNNVCNIIDLGSTRLNLQNVYLYIYIYLKQGSCLLQNFA